MTPDPLAVVVTPKEMIVLSQIARFHFKKALARCRFVAICETQSKPPEDGLGSELGGSAAASMLPAVSGSWVDSLCSCSAQCSRVPSSFRRCYSVLPTCQPHWAYPGGNTFQTGELTGHGETQKMSHHQDGKKPLLDQG